jgi:hypothetical protein
MEARNNERIEIETRSNDLACYRILAAQEYIEASEERTAAILGC